LGPLVAAPLEISAPKKLMYTRKTALKFRTDPIRIPRVRFAIVGNPRTGSSHLVSLLDSHPDVACWDDEIFDEGEAFDKSSYDNPRDFLLESVFNVDARAVGFKLLWDAMSRTAKVWNLLEELDILLVHTCRANLLDSFISYQLATINRAFTCWYGDYKTQRFEARYDQCLEWFETAEFIDIELRQRALKEGIPRIEIEYTELCRNQDRVLEFLGVSRLPLTSRLTKQRKGSQSEILTNYADLKERFAGSKWAKNFED
jgi:LPS sulfotransferase NodH